jgi:hypothetical protein
MNDQPSGPFWTRCLRIASLALLLCTPALGQETVPVSGKRVALVIGNSRYDDEDQPEVSGAEDARAVADLLRLLGFDPVELVPDAHLKDMTDAITRFQKNLKGAEAGVFFYSGHGFQSSNFNFMLPIGGSTAAGKSVPVDDVLGAFSAAPEAAKFLFLDACRTETRLPKDFLRGLAKPQLGPGVVVQAFAAGPGTEAASGPKDGKSPYTLSLLKFLPVPGLAIKNFFEQLRFDVTSSSSMGQSPTETDSSGVPDTFFFKPAVVLRGQIEDASDELLVSLNGQIVMDGRKDHLGVAALTLRPGVNDLSLVVANRGVYRNHQSWQDTEGWSYTFRLFDREGDELRELRLPDCGTEQRACFSDGEPAPFKEGPHHGRAFPVAKATIYVDPITANVSLTGGATDLWKKEIPFHFLNQDLLFEETLDRLPLDRNADLRRYLRILNYSRTLLKALKLLDAVKFPETKNLAFRVHGNLELREAVETCLGPAKIEDRLREAAEGVAEALRGVEKPFVPFDRGLSTCVRAEAGADLQRQLGSDDLILWTSLRDLSEKGDETNAKNPVIQPAVRGVAKAPARP